MPESGADDDDQIVTLQSFAERADRHWQRPSELRMRLWKRGAIGQGRQVHRSFKLPGECDAGVPAATAVDLLAIDQYGNTTAAYDAATAMKALKDQAVVDFEPKASRAT